MSITSNIHTAVVYESKGANKTQPQFGQRLVVTIAKADKDGNYGPNLQQTMATSIPLLTVNDISFNDSRVQNAAIDYFRTIQNKIISDNIKETGKKEITTGQLSQAAILDYLAETEGTGDKLTKERIVEWFGEVLAENVTLALMEKGFDDAKLDASLNAYSKLISENFSSKVIIPAKKAEAIKKALDFGDQSDNLMIKFQARIAKILKPVDMDELLGL